MKNAVETSSRLRLWFLLGFTGRRVLFRYRRPLWVALGITLYATRWVVGPA
ncbi:MAG: hypothetical protein JXR94_03755 [Candidatus Hydrogenedentes bacterium]|nr:hypothetical protein [Candidatus Hydrogenedentota bacterium]